MELNPSLSMDRERKQPKRKRMLLLSSPPATRITSGYHALKSDNSKPANPVSFRFEVEPFCWLNRLDWPISPKKVYLLDGYRISLSFLRCLLNGRFSVIVTTGLPVMEAVPAFFLAKILGIPIIIKETHWYWPKTFLSQLTWPANRLLVSNADLVLCPGKRAYEYWHSVGVSERKLRILHFYSSILQFNEKNKALAAQLRSTFNEKIVILYFGRLIKKKGAEYLIKAFSKLNNNFQNIVLVLVGEGPERAHLEKLCADLQLRNVLFVGAVDESLKPAYFLSADVYVYPSVTLELPEEWPLGVVEAMSAGKPVIVSTAVGSAPDVVKQGINGYLVPEKDIDALYDAIKRLIESNQLKEMGLASKEIVESSFSTEGVIRDFDTAIETVLNQRNRS